MSNRIILSHTKRVRRLVVFLPAMTEIEEFAACNTNLALAYGETS